MGEAIGAASLPGLELFGAQSRQVGCVVDLPSLVEAASVPRDLMIAVEDADGLWTGQHHQGSPDLVVGDRVVVSLE